MKLPIVDATTVVLALSGQIRSPGGRGARQLPASPAPSVPRTTMRTWLPVTDAMLWGRCTPYSCPDEDIVYLVMDNAGGHGTDDCVKEYTHILFEDYNIQIIQQVPRSPETNVLDLGIWCHCSQQLSQSTGANAIMPRCFMQQWLKFGPICKCWCFWERFQQASYYLSWYLQQSWW